MADPDDEAVLAQRAAALRNALEPVIEHRKQVLINQLVNDLRQKKLTHDQCIAAVSAFAELDSLAALMERDILQSEVQRHG